jgi:RimJ/RimL family protein N-acetyltransferase
MPPRRVDLGDGLLLRPFRVSDADALAEAVRLSLDHLRPWMAWADNGSADPSFQRRRLVTVEQQWERREEFQYGLFAADDPRVLGSFGLMTRRGRGRLEIGYWVHVDATGNGYATRAAAALTDVALAQRRIEQVLIYTDEANVKSAAIPKKLGYELLRFDEEPKTAPAETGRLQVWGRATPIADTQT